MNTKIEWAEETWNPVTGCTPISEGCKNCYARRMANRLMGRYGYPTQRPFDVTFHHDRLDQPSRWRKPRTVFVCSMGDLFHDDVTDQQILAIVTQAARTRVRGHRFLFLTKRPKRMRDFFCHLVEAGFTFHEGCTRRLPGFFWLGVTAENQARADERIPILFQIPAAVRFVSIEPMLGPVDLREYLQIQRLVGTIGNFQRERDLHWVIVGGETGPGARPMEQAWAYDVHRQCDSAGVPFFFKKWGSATLLGGTSITERTRQFPEAG